MNGGLHRDSGVSHRGDDPYGEPGVEGEGHHGEGEETRVSPYAGVVYQAAGAAGLIPAWPRFDEKGKDEINETTLLSHMVPFACANSSFLRYSLVFPLYLFSLIAMLKSSRGRAD